MGNLKYIILFLFIFLFINKVNAYSSYNIEDYLYYDPVNANSVCNKYNYWTFYNQNTTCYRFIVLTKNDTQSNSTIKAMLDHDIAKTQYNNYKSVLDNEMKKWVRYKGEYDIIDEDTIDDMMLISSSGIQRPNLNNISVNARVPNYMLSINTYDYYNGSLTSDYGYWSKTLFNNQYAYTITEYGNNRLVKTNQTRGVRPVVYLNKNEINNSDGLINITNNINLKIQNTYDHNKYNNLLYTQLQGFTLTSNKLVLHAVNSNDSTNGLLMTFTGNNYNSRVDALTKFDTTGHGNDLAYNSLTNKIILVGANNYEEIWIYNADTLNVENKINTYKKNGLKIHGIAYDKEFNVYIALSSRKICILDSNFNVMYSFDIPTTLVSQGVGYYRGYAFYTTSSAKCPSNHQLYCLYSDNASITYVYNVKFGSDGRPTNDFGKLVAKYYIGEGLGELESISFKDNSAYFGFGSYKYDNNNVFKFYEYNAYNFVNDFNFNVNSTKDGNNIKIDISSNSSLNEVAGFVRSGDGKVLTKIFTKNDQSQNYTICDIYGYCKNYYYDSNTYFKQDNKNNSNNTNNKNNNNNNNNNNSGNETSNNSNDNTNSNENNIEPDNSNQGNNNSNQVIDDNQENNIDIESNNNNEKKSNNNDVELFEDDNFIYIMYGISGLFILYVGYLTFKSRRRNNI